LHRGTPAPIFERDVLHVPPSFHVTAAVDLDDAAVVAQPS